MLCLGSSYVFFVHSKIIQQKNSKLRKESKSDSDMQPLDAIKHNTLKMIRHSENHRFAALKDLPVFCKYMHRVCFLCLTNVFFIINGSFAIAVLTDEQLKIVIQNMEEIHMHKGQVIVRQDDHGDTCFVVEDGNVVVTVSPVDCVYDLVLLFIDTKFKRVVVLYNGFSICLCTSESKMVVINWKFLVKLRNWVKARCLVRCHWFSQRREAQPSLYAVIVRPC